MTISTKGSASSQGATLPAFTEHRVPHAGGSLYVRDFPGSGPAFVLLHGFPDNLHIYDDLIPHLAAAGPPASWPTGMILSSPNASATAFRSPSCCSKL